MTVPRKKLIEVALPLPEINDASAYDKMPGIGPHPKGIHHWWARLPLPTARAVLFASVVTDPSDDPAWKDKGEQEQDAERERLFGIIRRMMGKKLHEHPEVYAEARAEMLKHCDGKLPPVLDPFAGGGSIPLEASRLGFEANAGDLNPVAVLLNKCNLELAPRWANHPPVNPEDRAKIGGGQALTGTHGLAADVRYYGRLIREQAQKKIGDLYPKVPVVQERDGAYRLATPDENNSPKSMVQNLNVIAWLWARTVCSDNAAARGAHVPLISTYWLSSATGKLAWLRPFVDRSAGTYRFEIRLGAPEGCVGKPQGQKWKDHAKDCPACASIVWGTKLARGAKFKCLLTGEPMADDHIKREALAGRLGYRLLAICAEKKGGRVYLPANEPHETAVHTDEPTNAPTERLTYNSRYLTPPGYGISAISDFFNRRQLTAMVTLSDLVKVNHSQALKDAKAAGLSGDNAIAYSHALTTFLALAVDRCVDFNNALCGWSSTNQKVMHLFGRGAIPMLWDFSEANTLADSVGAWSTCSDYVAECVEVLGSGKAASGHAAQADAAHDTRDEGSLLVSTDPPYYDNVPYAAISDFFYVWLRRIVGNLHPEIFSTVLVPKMPELTAMPDRFDGDKEKAKEHFESGFRRTFTHLRERLDPRFPLTVYYAFKQEDEESDGNDGDSPNGTVDLTTGWETLLEALISSGFTITATCPVRASQAWRMRAMGSNALASYIVLACRPRPADAPRAGRNGFVAELKKELPSALRHLQQGNVAPVDFAQAAIGPGMAVFSRYSAVLESNGKPMSVRTALALINGIKDELLGEAVEELDKDTRWATTWFSGTGFEWGEAGQANLLANAQATAVNGLVADGIVEVKGNQVRLFRPDELPADWDPETDKRLTVWEMTHHLVRVYVHEKKGDAPTAALMKKLGSKADVARDLAYKLFTVCENKKWSKEAQAYNALVMGWAELTRLSRETSSHPPLAQPTLFGDTGV